MVSIARKNLLEDLPRFLVAQAGIMFAVSLVTIQTGILNGFTRSTVLLIDSSKADIWLSSDRMVQFEYTEPLSIIQLNATKKIEGVERAEAISIASQRWYPANSTESSSLRIIGFDPNGKLLQPGNIVKGNLKDLSKPYTIMAEKSRLDELHINSIGQKGKIENFPASVVAFTENTQSLVASPFVFTSLDNANAYANAGYSSQVDCKMQTAGDLNCTTVYKQLPESAKSQAPTPKPLSVSDPITYILVKAKPGQDIDALKQRLEKLLPGTSAYTKAEMSQKLEIIGKSARVSA